MNIFIALVGVVVWNESDEIALSEDGDTTLKNFLQYRRTKLVVSHPNDNAQLLTKVQFSGGVVGKYSFIFYQSFMVNYMFFLFCFFEI